MPMLGPSCDHLLRHDALLCGRLDINPCDVLDAYTIQRCYISLLFAACRNHLALPMAC